VCSSPR